MPFGTNASLPVFTTHKYFFLSVISGGLLSSPAANFFATAHFLLQMQSATPTSDDETGGGYFSTAKDFSSGFHTNSGSFYQPLNIFFLIMLTVHVSMLCQL